MLITITEGRYHQIKRMFQVYNGKVIYLKRISMGGLSLPEALVKGTYYKITKEELERGLQSC